MKLYATIESNRAKKGQGGDWLDIDIFTTNREEASHRVLVRESAGEITIRIQRKHFGKWYESKEIDTVYINAPETKGNKQKGETLHDDRDYNINPCRCGQSDCPSNQ